MMKRIVKIIVSIIVSIIVAAAMLISSTCAFANGEDLNNTISMKIGKKEANAFGKTVVSDVAPIIKNERTMLPARFVAENLGAKVEWNDETKTITIISEDEQTKINLVIGSKSAKINNRAVDLDSPPFIENERTYTPVRFIAEALGATVTWDSKNQEVIITKESENEKEISKLMSDVLSLNGTVSYGVHFYNDDVKVIKNSQRMHSASVIKLFIMDYAFKLVGEGKLSLDDEINGATLKNHIEQMITVSSNESTNELIEFLGMDNINENIINNGYQDTELQRKMLDYEAINQGKDNYTSVFDVMKFLDNLYANKDSFLQSEMLEIMKRQKVKTKIRKNIPSGVVIANKTGEMGTAENDVGIIFTDNGDCAVVFMTDCKDGTGIVRDKIANSALNIYNAMIN